MKEYLKTILNYWEEGYEAENVESIVFRTYGRIFKPLGFDGKGQTLLDFGCGEGAVLEFYQKKGFDVYGVDISKKAIEACQRKMPDIKDHFKVIDPQALETDVFFPDVFYDVVVGIQAFYYYSDDDLQQRLISLNKQMKDKSIIYATMIGTKHKLYRSATDWKDGLSVVNLDSSRVTLNNYYANFTESEADLIQKFSLFDKITVGHYEFVYTPEEGIEFHHTFLGGKRS